MHILAFGVGCIAARMALACIPMVIEPETWGAYLYTAILAVIGLAFGYLWITQSRMNAPEAGGVTWWASARVGHSILFLVAAGLLGAGYNAFAARVLVLDVLFGTILWANKRLVDGPDVLLPR